MHLVELKPSIELKNNANEVPAPAPRKENGISSISPLDTVAQLHANMDKLKDLHSRFNFMLREVNGLVKR